MGILEILPDELMDKCYDLPRVSSRTRAMPIRKSWKRRSVANILPIS